MRRSVLFALAALLLLGETANAQTRRPAAPGKPVVRESKVSDFDPNLVYYRCDPSTIPSGERRVWQFPGRSPMVPQALLRAAGLNGRVQSDFERAVLGVPDSEDMPDFQRKALKEVNDLVRIGVLRSLVLVNGERRIPESEEEGLWRRFQDIVRAGNSANYLKARTLPYRCGDRVGTMTFNGGLDVNGNLTVLTRHDYVMGFTPSVEAWGVGIETPSGYKMVNIILECFNINPTDATAPAVDATPLVAAPLAAAAQPQLFLPLVQKRWLDSKMRETKPPRNYTLRFLVRDVDTNEVVKSFEYGTSVVGTRLDYLPGSYSGPLPMPGTMVRRDIVAQPGTIFLQGPLVPQKRYVLLEDPASIPKGWRSQGPVLFTLKEGPEGTNAPLTPVNVKDKSRFSCGPAKVYCWGPPLAAVAIWGLTRGGGDDDRGRSPSPPDAGKPPTPLPPRP